MAQKQRKLIIVGIIIAGIVLITLFLLGQRSSGKAMVVSVSSDGHYVLSSNEDKTIVLWNLKRHNYRVVGTNANIYSAYFIPHSHKFIWQDLNDIVHVLNVEGTQLKHFHNFPTYGEVMTSNLKHYFASNQKWGLYHRYGSKLEHKENIKSHCDENGFLAVGKLLNLSLSDNEKRLLSVGDGVGYGKVPTSVGQCSDQAGEQGYEVGITNQSLLEGPVLWQVKTGQPIRKFPGLLVKSFATISPANSQIIGGDEQGNIFRWDLNNPESKLRLYDPMYGKTVRKGPKAQDLHFDKSHLLKRPDDFKNKVGMYDNANMSIKFIDKNYFIRLIHDIPYGVLYTTDSARIKAYLSLGEHPYPSIDDYERNASIDTSWRAHVLVTGQKNQGGIIVYKYNPNKQTLKKVWVPQPKKWQVWWREWI